MRTKEQILRQLSRPPSVANWVRHNYRRLDDTTRGLLRFALSPPRHSLGEVYSVCEAIVVDRISLPMALKCVEGIKHPLTRKAGEQIIPEFFEYARSNGLDGLGTFKGFRSPYPIGRGPDGATLSVPVVPTFTIIIGDKPTPVFLIGWSKLALNGYQKSLLSTIIKNAILTQQDFMSSDALVLCTPKYKSTELRQVQSWSVREYATLSEEQLLEQFDRYGSALVDVLKTVSGG